MLDVNEQRVLHPRAGVDVKQSEGSYAVIFSHTFSFIFPARRVTCEYPSRRDETFMARQRGLGGDLKREREREREKDQSEGEINEIGRVRRETRLHVIKRVPDTRI